MTLITLFNFVLHAYEIADIKVIASKHPSDSEPFSFESNGTTHIVITLRDTLPDNDFDTTINTNSTFIHETCDLETPRCIERNHIQCFITNDNVNAIHCSKLNDDYVNFIATKKVHLPDWYNQCDMLAAFLLYKTVETGVFDYAKLTHEGIIDWE